MQSKLDEIKQYSACAFSNSIVHVLGYFYSFTGRFAVK